MNHKERVYCGVDVSKDHLDVLFKGRPDRFENSVKGARAMVRAPEAADGLSRCSAQRGFDRHEKASGADHQVWQHPCEMDAHRMRRTLPHASENIEGAL